MKRGAICVVTGANSGIGKVLARELAARGGDVIMVCRDRARGEAALDETRRGATGEVSLELADLSRLREVRALAERLRARAAHIDVLCNNAGLYLPARRETDDGLEVTFTVNHLAPFLLTNLLRDRLAAAGGARVVTTASGAHRWGRLDLDDLMMARRRWSAARQYGNGKLANILFTAELARRLAGDGVRATCFHPGAVATGFGQDERGLLNGLMKLGHVFLRSPERGADTGVYLATSPEVADVTGAYFHDRRPARSSRASGDPELARGLWQKSETLTGLA